MFELKKPVNIEYRSVHGQSQSYNASEHMNEVCNGNKDYDNDRGKIE